MLVLGIETSCDETAASVVEDGRRVLSNIVLSQVKVHAVFRGVVPEIASRNHVRAIVPVVDMAIKEAKIELAQIDGIAVTIGPGLIGSLLVGVQFAKSLALALQCPIVGLNHLESHVMAAFLGESPPQFPFVALAVSGGHTSLFLVSDFGAIRLLGRTRDDAAGEAFDKAAALLGLPYPGGVHIDRASSMGDPRAVPFPRPMLHDESTLDFSFSGLKTALRRHIQDLPKPLPEQTVKDLAASFQEAVVDVLVYRTLQAARLTNSKTIVVAGGVAANSRLRQRMYEASAEAGLNLHLVDLAYCTDNGAMVASLGYHYLFGALEKSEGVQRGLSMDPFAKVSPFF